FAAVIDPVTEHLVWVCEPRQLCDFGLLVVGHARVSGLAYFGNPASRERVTQARVTQTLVQGDHAIAGHHAEARLSISHIARELHSQLHASRARWPAQEPVHPHISAPLLPIDWHE